ncbi:MAG TPA: alpha/beta hydrolase [Candidatus Limnocylindrales bacterium]|nr:alpha/beta hydrolase [Candidatus Limnocylindrales bacterium]
MSTPRSTASDPFAFRSETANEDAPDRANEDARDRATEDAPDRVTERVEVAPGVELAIDRWVPVGHAAAPGSAAGEGVSPVAERSAPAAGPPAAAPRPAAPPATPTFLLVHGLASNARLWDGVAADLAARGLTAATVDLRGHGRSSKPADGYDIPTVAADLAALIEQAGLGRPVVAGQSWGGNVVLELAAAHPEAVTAIACVDGGWLDPQATFPDWEACLARLAPPRLAGLPGKEIEAHIRAAHPDWPEAGIQGTLANFEHRPDGTIAPWLTYDRHIDVLRGMWAFRPAKRYSAVRVPVLLLPVKPTDAPEPNDSAEPTRRPEPTQAAAAVAAKREAVAVAQAALPRATVHWSRGDHDIHAQHPAEVAALLVDLAHLATT